MTRNTHITIVGFVVLVLLLTSILWLRHSFQVHQQPVGTTDSIELLSASTNTVPEPAATNQSVEAVLEDKVKAYRQGLISKAEVMQQVWDNENARSLEFYGKLVDQTGQPVVGVKVVGNIMFQMGYAGTRDQIHETTSDANGLFEFSGLHGAMLGVIPSKPGYEYSYKYSHSNWTEDYGLATS